MTRALQRGDRVTVRGGTIVHPGKSGTVAESGILDGGEGQPFATVDLDNDGRAWFLHSELKLEDSPDEGDAPDWRLSRLARRERWRRGLGAGR